MPNIIGENFYKYVAEQVNARQKVHGKRNRSASELLYLNSKTSWVKLISSVKITDSKRLTNLNIPSTYAGTELAKNFILFNGTSNTENALFSGIDRTNSFVSKYAYGIGGNEMGLRPMPGISSIDVKNRNRGSIREATVNFKVWNRVQLEIVDLLYLRLGFPILLEWGNSVIVNNDGTIDTKPDFRGISEDFLKGTYTDDYQILDAIEKQRKLSQCNYDAMYGRVVNFNWSFNKNGSYDITLKIISIGAVIESLKLNIYTGDKFDTSKTPTSTESSPTDTEPVSDNDWVMKFKFSHEIGKLFYNVFSSNKQNNSAEVNIIPVDSIQQAAAYKRVLNNSSIPVFQDGDFLHAVKPDKYYIRLGSFLNFIQYLMFLANVKNAGDPKPILKIDTDKDGNLMYSNATQLISSNPNVCIVGGYSFSSSTGNVIDVIKSIPSEFGWKIDNDVFKPSRIMNIYLNTSFILQQLESAKDDNGKVAFFGFIQSVLIEVNKALGSLNSLEMVINDSTNTATIIDSTPIPGADKLIPPNPNIAEKSPVIYSYGYYNNGTENQAAGFVRDISIQTKISNETISMLSIGATANGSVVGEDATSFSKWNAGLEPIINSKIDYAINSEKPETPEEKINTLNNDNQELFKSYGQYQNKYWKMDFDKNEDFSQYSDLVQRYLEYKQELQSLTNLQSGKKIAAPISSKGFFPVGVSVTLDGISGIAIYQNLNLDISFLPSSYPTILKFIITGVSHKIDKNGWVTTIDTVSTTLTEEEAVVKESTPVSRASSRGESKEEVGPDKGVQSTSLADCNAIPSWSRGQGKDKGRIKASSTDNAFLTQTIILIEGGYYHPVQAYGSDNQIKKGFKVMAASGETLWGIDRAAGAWQVQNSPPERIRLGNQFWGEIDKYSGYGKYADNAKRLITKNWPVSQQPPIPTAWKYLSNDAKNYPVLTKYLDQMMSYEFDTVMNRYFGKVPDLKSKIYSDGRLKFHYYRLLWNGVGFMKKASVNLINLWNGGEKDPTKLTCKNLTYMYNIYSKNSLIKESLEAVKFLTGL